MQRKLRSERSSATEADRRHATIGTGGAGTFAPGASPRSDPLLEGSSGILPSGPQLPGNHRLRDPALPDVGKAPPAVEHQAAPQQQPERR